MRSAVDTDAFDYDLPPERIAQQPLAERDAARLLVDDGPGRPARHLHVRDLPELLQPGDLVVVNDTRVLPARLHLRKPTGGAAEVLLLDQGVDGTWEVLARPSRDLRDGMHLVPARAEGAAAALDVEIVGDLGEGRRLVRLHLPDDVGLLDALGAAGEVPLPPYITAHLDDPERYQTVYAARPASAAAPTAGLHFTPAVLRGLERRGVQLARVELVVGLGTFRPITAAAVEDHVMHAERYRVAPDVMAAVDDAHASGNDVVAIGTTVVRALESVAATGELEGATDLYIHGEYRFRIVDRLLTNFHLPRSSLLVMIESFMGPRWRELYAEAIGAGYRFLSFGDAMLLRRRPAS